MKRREFLAFFGTALVSARNIALAQTPSPPSAAKQSKPVRIVVVAYTYYEGDGVMSAVCNRMAHDARIGVPRDVVWPRQVATDDRDIIPKPRCLIDAQASTGATTAVVEVWCLDDLMSSHVPHGSSDKKALAMRMITEYGPAPDGVVAFGTAGYPGDPSNDGCATIGSTIFIRDAANDGSGEHSNWTWPGHMGVLVPSKTPTTFFSSVIGDQATVDTISREMLAVPVNPAAKLQLIIAADAVAISSVNIPRGSDFGPVDSRAIAAAQNAGAMNITSVETTHGVIRAQWPDAFFIYVTAIPNRVGHFADEAGGNYAQEFASTHNAGIALKHIMPHFVAAIA